LERQQAFGVETHSLCADPKFVDAARGDFRLSPDSPALKLGFQAIDLAKIGLREGHPFYQPTKQP
jgi:hypothetical protein